MHQGRPDIEDVQLLTHKEVKALYPGALELFDATSQAEKREFHESIQSVKYGVDDSGILWVFYRLVCPGVSSNFVYVESWNPVTLSWTWT